MEIISVLYDWVVPIIEFMVLLFVFFVGCGVLWIIILYILDVSQTKHAVRRNYPVVGRLRYSFESLGEFFRQYFFAMDREELPFNRADRSWVYRAAKNIDSTLAFGSTRDLRPTGTIMFANAPFPTLGRDAVEADPLTIGPGAKHPFTTSSIFNISGMSYGAISRPAVTALSNGARMAGCWMNTGEGGLSPYHLLGECDLVFQIGTAKYGVRDEAGELSDDRLREVAAHERVRMFEIKLSQGAKPGKGGILPGGKVTPEIARIRGISQGEASISPNRHTDITNISDLLNMIARIREVTGKPVGFKSVIGGYEWIDELAVEIHRRGLDSAPDFITIDSADGGTGAAPMSLIDNMGLPIHETLPKVCDLLWEHGLKERILVFSSGKLITPNEVAWALCMGADFVTSARGFMFALGCIQALQCNKNTCPTGITTHNKRLQLGLDPKDKAVRVANYAKNLRHEVGVIAHSCGVASVRGLRREHVRTVMPNGLSTGLIDLYPYPGASKQKAASG